MLNLSLCMSYRGNISSRLSLVITKKSLMKCLCRYFIDSHVISMSKSSTLVCHQPWNGHEVSKCFFCTGNGYWAKKKWRYTWYTVYLLHVQRIYYIIQYALYSLQYKVYIVVVTVYSMHRCYYSIYSMYYTHYSINYTSFLLQYIQYDEDLKHFYLQHGS